MIPLKDDNPVSIFPFVTIGLIAANAAGLVLQIISPLGPQRVAFAYGAIPSVLLTFSSAQPIHPVLTIFTSMFMHGGLLHLATNMLYLWIFGNNIEDKLGHVRFTVFYLLCGVAASYAHAITDPSSRIPMIGASGAVSGVLGAYLYLFPQARIHTLIFFGFFVQVVKLPAIFVIGLWILFQFLNGLISRGFAGQSGVAWFAHIGGFLAGLLLIMLVFRVKRRK
ncbi:MAG: rhomboid family intramembrane serine protease [Nitrospirae bacterium]|nr:rhomboid family intramembrane serine protease [Nitrospirota bacterium]